MKDNSSILDNIFDLAIGREQSANRFYTDLARMVKNTSVKETFTSLAKEELSHEALLKTLKADPGLQSKLKPSKDYRVAESESQPAISEDMPLSNAVALAMKKEQQAAELYRSLAKSSTDADTRTLFENLTNMELGHKNKLEALFVDIGYPEVF
ncbi:MAG: ferritin family protein [bacterium]